MYVSKYLHQAKIKAKLVAPCNFELPFEKKDHLWFEI